MLRNLLCDPELGVRILQILTASTVKLSKEPKMSILGMQKEGEPGGKGERGREEEQGRKEKQPES